MQTPCAGHDPQVEKHCSRWLKIYMSLQKKCYPTGSSYSPQTCHSSLAQFHSWGLRFLHKLPLFLSYPLSSYPILCSRTQKSGHLSRWPLASDLTMFYQCFSHFHAARVKGLTIAAEGRKGLFWITVWGCVRSGRSMRCLATRHPQSRSRERWLLVLSSLSLLYLACRMVFPRFLVGFPTSINPIEKTPHRHTLIITSWMIWGPVKFTPNLRHHI